MLVYYFKAVYNLLYSNAYSLQEVNANDYKYQL